MKKWFASQNKVTQNFIQLVLMMAAVGIATIAIGLIVKRGF
jgi:hypothetical protein